jgi:molybdenum cofactor cytidylyltransferase
METVIIILAAGSSSRMGQSKQMMKIDDVTLLKRSVLTALQSGIGPVVVVVGAHEEEHRKEIENTAHIISNANWENGMGSSLKSGLRHAQKLFQVENIIVMVCDQPHVSPSILKNLQFKMSSTQKSIIASAYAEVVGVPVLFNKIFFNEILRLPDSGGARKIIERHPSETFLVEFPEGSVDLDTPEDYRSFTKE